MMLRHGYMNIGPVAIRYRRLKYASCLPLLQIGGLSLFSRDSGGELMLASYHPCGCLTWHWCVSLKRLSMKRWISRADRRIGQWHDYYGLPFGSTLVISCQDYHRQHRALLSV